MLHFSMILVYCTYSLYSFMVLFVYFPIFSSYSLNFVLFSQMF